MSTSGSTLYSKTRDQIITRAYRITGDIGTGELPSTSMTNDGAEALNDLVKKLHVDGMPLWKVRRQGPFTYTATNTYTIGTGSTFAAPAPLKILQAWNRNTAAAPADSDTPMLIVTDQDYDYIGAKNSTGTPTQLVYTVPGAGVTTVSDMQGTIKVYPKPDTSAISTFNLYIMAQLPFEDFVISTDVPDFPSYWYNALVWLLAAELGFESGVNLSRLGMIQKKAQNERLEALSFGSEEGSIYIRPNAQYEGAGGGLY